MSSTPPFFAMHDQDDNSDPESQEYLSGTPGDITMGGMEDDYKEEMPLTQQSPSIVPYGKTMLESSDDDVDVEMPHLQHTQQTRPSHPVPQGPALQQPQSRLVKPRRAKPQQAKPQQAQPQQPQPQQAQPQTPSQPLVIGQPMLVDGVASVAISSVATNGPPKQAAETFIKKKSVSWAHFDLAKVQAAEPPSKLSFGFRRYYVRIRDNLHNDVQTVHDMLDWIRMNESANSPARIGPRALYLAGKSLEDARKLSGLLGFHPSREDETRREQYWQRKRRIYEDAMRKKKEVQRDHQRAAEQLQREEYGDQEREIQEQQDLEARNQELARQQKQAQKMARNAKKKAKKASRPSEMRLTDAPMTASPTSLFEAQQLKIAQLESQVHHLLSNNQRRTSQEAASNSAPRDDGSGECVWVSLFLVFRFTFGFWLSSFTRKAFLKFWVFVLHLGFVVVLRSQIWRVTALCFFSKKGKVVFPFRCFQVF